MNPRTGALAGTALAAMMALAALGPWRPASANINADINGDGAVNSIDAAIILQYTAGLLTDLKTVRPMWQYAVDATASSEGAEGTWDAMQATRGPDTVDGTGALRCGDFETAWAPASAGPGPEWLEVMFGIPVNATGLIVYETHNAGFIYRIDLIDTDGGYHTLFTGTDTTTCPGEFRLTFPRTSYLVEGMRIHTQRDGWEEIDAVRLEGFREPS